MRITVRSILGRYTLLVPFLLLPLAGCCSVPFGKAIQTAKETAKASDVALILLGKDNAYFPERLLARRGLHVVVWIANAESLKIVFKDPTKTGGVDKAECLKTLPFVCYWLPPDNLNPDTIEYTATLTCKGKELTPIDPRIEIVP